MDALRPFGLIGPPLPFWAQNHFALPPSGNQETNTWLTSHETVHSKWSSPTSG